jgi:hypothetical protein
MSKSPETFRTAVFEGQGSALDMMFGLIGRIFTVAKAKEDEIEAIYAITLVISLIENIPGLESTLPELINHFISELSLAKTPEYKLMLMQGISMSLW